MAFDTDCGLYLFLHVASSFFLSAAHNVLFFVLDLRTPIIHWLHFLSASVFLFLLALLGCLTAKRLSLRDYALPVSLQLVASLLSARVHAQNRSGSLYLVRCVLLSSSSADSSTFSPPSSSSNSETNL